ncbi:DUF4838 domain-containing protein [Planctomycetota bacterium]
MRSYVLLCGLFTLTAACAMAAPLVKDGKPTGEFVLPDPPAQAEVFATSDVRDWIEKITGAKVPILTKPSTTTNEKIFVGTAHAGGFREDLARLKGNDGFAVRRRGNRVHVFGSRPRGTLYGLYALLERNTDLIFARPNEEFGTIYGKTPTLELTETDFIDIPVFLIRQLGPNWPKHRPTGVWLLRNRDNRRDNRANYKGFIELDLCEQYNTNFAVPIARHAHEHPEYFGYDPVTKSRRFVRHGEGTMCLSTPGLPSIWAKGLAENVAAYEARVGRKVELIRVGPGDNWFCCQCKRCLAPLTLQDGSRLECQDPNSIKDPLFRSTQIMMFVNQAMATWKQLRPDTPIHLLAYIHFAEPPRVPVHPDLRMWLAPYPTNNMHYPLLDPRQPEPWRRRFEKWLTMTSCLGFYEYFHAKPSPEAFYAAANLRAVMRLPDHRHAIIYAEIDNDFGTAGIGDGEFGWDVGLMNRWVYTRLFWDPTQDVDALYRYFIRRAYRGAAPQMLAYYEMIKASWLDPENKTVTACHTSIAHVYKGLIVDRGLEPQCMRMLSEAEAASKHPHSRTLIRRMRAQYAGFSKSMARLIVAAAPEMATDAGAFDSLQWNKPVACDDFKGTSRTKTPTAASETTAVSAVHDGKNLYVRFTASDRAMARQEAMSPVPGKERWPQGDHIEFWLFGGRDRYVFALNAAGASYDAKNLDRRWQSGWTVRVRKNESGWEAVAVIPMSVFRFESAKKTHFRWFCTREIRRTDGSAEQVSYQGRPLYYRSFPVVIQ